MSPQCPRAAPISDCWPKMTQWGIFLLFWGGSFLRGGILRGHPWVLSSSASPAPTVPHLWVALVPWDWDAQRGDKGQCPQKEVPKRCWGSVLILGVTPSPGDTGHSVPIFGVIPIPGHTSGSVPILRVIPSGSVPSLGVMPA